MAVAIPVIAAFASAGAAVAAAGGVAAALGTVTGFLAIGGAALTAVGAITKNSKLTKIGAVLGLAGGVGSALGIGANAAGSASGAAAQEAANAAWSSGGAAEVAGGAGASALETAKQAAALPQGMDAAAAETASQSANNLALSSAGADVGGSGLKLDPSLYQTANSLKTPGTVDPSIYSLSPLQTRATGAGLTMDDVAAGLKTSASKAGSAISPVGQWVKDNKELVGIGGSMLAAGLGAIPAFAGADRLAQRDKWEQSIYNRRMANLNSPIALYNKG